MSFTDEQVDEICRSLRDKGLIEWDETTREASLTPAGWDHYYGTQR